MIIDWMKYFIQFLLYNNSSLQNIRMYNVKGMVLIIVHKTIIKIILCNQTFPLQDSPLPKYSKSSPSNPSSSNSGI